MHVNDLILSQIAFLLISYMKSMSKKRIYWQKVLTDGIITKQRLKFILVCILMIGIYKKLDLWQHWNTNCFWNLSMIQIQRL